MMSLSASAGVRPCTVAPGTRRSRAPAPKSAAAGSFVQRRQVAARGLGDLIGEVNDPEKTRANEKAKKEGDGAWSEPAPNKNPLEKTNIMHGIGAEGQEVDSDLVENAKEGVEDAVEGVKEAVKKVTGGDK
mmetsp:Transcript_4037/g.11710  ORF Transcript_4037/g.11710 Transcript_4037/m.11710 type:complete len:131 (-) Transcript_4037:355-747(-)